MSLHARTRAAAVVGRARRSPFNRSAIAVAIGLSVGLPSLSLKANPVLAQGVPFDCATLNLFPMFCRGPLPYQVEGVIHKFYSFSFNRNPTGVGPDGTGSPLAMGSCAFADRAVSSAEPTTLNGGFMLQLSGPDGGGEIVDPLYTAISQCNATPASCVFQVCITNNGNIFSITQGTGATLTITAPEN
jgi:hypothetical protein